MSSLFNPHEIDARMLSACSMSPCGESSVLQAIRDLLAAGGSHLRGRLCLDASLKLAIAEPDAITLATICELLHNASLVHDDLLDRAPQRRGRPSTWAAYDDTVAVCAGDLMLSSAFGLLGELSRPEMLRPVLARVHRRTQEVILGQGAENAVAPRTLLEYEFLASGKSTSLLSLPFELALLYSGNADHLVAANKAASAFAVGYQMADDLKDYTEDVQNGSLNAVHVALLIGSPNLTAAYLQVSDRAEELLLRSVEDAASLPKAAGATMMAQADSLKAALVSDRTLLLQTTPYGG